MSLFFVTEINCWAQKFSTQKVATLPRQKSKADIQLRVVQVTKVFKRLQDARVQAAKKYVEDKKNSQRL